MARKTRRAKKTVSKPKLSWKILFLGFTPILVLAFILLRSNNQNVLGTSTTNLFRLGVAPSVSISPKPGQNCKQLMISAISVISFLNPCTSKGNAGYKTIQYTCANGTTGSYTTDCISPPSAFEKAGKTCSKNSKCAAVAPVVSKKPRPSGSTSPSRTPQLNRGNNSVSR